MSGSKTKTENKIKMGMEHGSNKKKRSTKKKQQQNRWLKALTYSPVGKWARGGAGGVGGLGGR